MKKEVILFLVMGIFLLNFVAFSGANEATQVPEAYTCLENKIDTISCSDLTLEEQVFSLMAVDKCETEVISDSFSEECWPGGSCKVKETAQAIFALDDANSDLSTSDAEEWLLGKKRTATGLDWFLEIEGVGELNCYVSYDGYENRNYDIVIGEDKKISKDAGSGAAKCLTRSTGVYKDYFYKISPECYNMEFEISCDKGFLTTLLFKKQGQDSPLHVSGEVHKKTVPKSKTTEIVNSYCFSDGSSCNYESSLWATFTLHRLGQDVKPYLPYLIIMKDDYERFMPDAFLKFLTGKFKSNLLNLQTGSGYWDVGSDNEKYYESALAAWALRYENNKEPVNNLKDWLLANQEDSGCWNSDDLRDTAFILRTVWPEYFVSANECVADADCIDKFGEDYYCDDSNTCKELPPEEKCYSDGDCDGDLVCNDAGECVDPPADPFCGDGILNGGEVCDGSSWGNIDGCSDIDGNWVGTLDCYSAGSAAECTFNTDGCYDKPVCESDEDCEGDLICNDNNECVNPAAVCGNGVKEAGEQCDGIDLNGKTCVDFGLLGDEELDCYSAGSINECKFDKTNCNAEEPVCEIDDECEGDLVCNDAGECVDPPEVDECSIDLDCEDKGDNLICSYGDCVNDPGSDNTCEDDDDCFSYQTCDGGVCIDNEYLDCEDEGYYCTSRVDCDGNILDSDYSDSCFSPYICCTKPKGLESCSEQNGEICFSDEKCVGGSEVEASNLVSGEVCCVDDGFCQESTEGSDCDYDIDCSSGEDCIERVCTKVSEEEYTCEQNEGVCKFSCSSNEKESSFYDCGGGDVCCFEEKKNSGGRALIWILLALIVLSVVGVVFRDKLRVWFVKLKTKFGKKGDKKRSKFPSLGLPPSHQEPSPRRPMQRRILPGLERPSRPSSGQGIRPKLPEKPGKKAPKKIGDLDEVLKKLKDIGK